MLEKEHRKGFSTALLERQESALWGPRRPRGTRQRGREMSGWVEADGSGSLRGRSKPNAPIFTDGS